MSGLGGKLTLRVAPLLGYSRQVRSLLALAALSLLGSSCVAKRTDASTRAHLISGFRLVMKSWDADRDGRLSRAEVQTMVNEAFRRMAQDARDGQAHPELEMQRQQMLGFYASQDANHDGYLSFDELLKRPLASFDCADRDHDGKVTKEEAFSSFDRCPSVNLDDYAPKP